MAAAIPSTPNLALTFGFSAWGSSYPRLLPFAVLGNPLTPPSCHSPVAHSPDGARQDTLTFDFWFPLESSVLIFAIEGS